ncbi:MAG: hypothetical protein JO345_29225 [Streptosporangiaceae bacterium]|nr:hypothetical protein [Streptosporangiaceae bacterium]
MTKTAAGTAAAGDAAVAQKALQEVSRLVGEATRRFQHEEFIEAVSSLTAIPSVLDPLISYVNHTWVTAASLIEPEADSGQPAGMYL